MHTTIKNFLQCLGICLGGLVILVAPETIRLWLDLLHDYVGPTALFITASALISIQEYHSQETGECPRRALRRSRQTAELCPALGTLGTLISLASADAMNVQLFAHAINSTLYGLGCLILFNFFTRSAIADLDEVVLPPIVNATIQPQVENQIPPQPKAEQSEPGTVYEPIPASQPAAAQGSWPYSNSPRHESPQQENVVVPEERPCQPQVNQPHQVAYS